MSGSIVQFRPTIGYNFEQLAVTTAVQVLTPSKYKNSETSGGASNALLSVETGDIRYTYDGTTPSGTVGHILKKNESIVLAGQNQMSQFKCFQESASVGSTITVTYERE